MLVVLGAIGLAAWMLLTSGDGQEQADPTPRVTQPTAQPSDTASSEPTKDEDKNGGDGDGDKGNGGNDKGGDGDKTGTGGNDNGGDDGNGDDGNDKGVQPVPQIPVYVFNQTTISGLAAETANALESGDWNVVGVDNWVGNVPSDTVYFYPGDRAAAERLSNDFPDIERVWPASAPMPAGALTVILADTARK
ncbi:MAG: LytR C-terminal domain-containing protein [Actinomycetia bacterium]|nr:LytR C-terminal domain-containing protein [Actinomycetes bacterium]